MRRNLFGKNGRLRAGAMLAAIVATAGFYALVETNSPQSAASANTGAGAVQPAPVNPPPLTVQPGLPGGAFNSSSPPARTQPASGGYTAPIVQPHTRTRAS